MKTFLSFCFCLILLFCASCQKDENSPQPSVETVQITNVENMQPIDSIKVTALKKANAANSTIITAKIHRLVYLNRYTLNDTVFKNLTTPNTVLRADSFYVRLKRYGFTY